MKARRILLAALLLAACREPFSNEDLIYLKALPTAAQVLTDVPGTTATSTSGVPAEGTPAATYAQTKASATELNNISTFVLDIVQQVSSFPPTVRDDQNDVRIWGPFPGKGVELIMTIKRVKTSTTVKTTSTSTVAELEEYFEYALAARRNPTDAWQAYFAGAWAPSEDLDSGMGRIFINLEAVRALQGDTNGGLIFIGYDTRFEQRTIEMAFDTMIDPTHPFKEAEGGYRFEERADGLTTFIFATRQNIPELRPDTGPELIVYRVRFLPDQRGRAEVAIVEGDLGSMAYYKTECWDENFMLTFAFGNIPGTMWFGTLDACAEPLRTSLGED